MSVGGYGPETDKTGHEAEHQITSGASGIVAAPLLGARTATVVKEAHCESRALVHWA